MNYKYLLIIFLFIIPTTMWSQVIIGSRTSPANDALLDLKNALENEEDDYRLANRYINLAKVFLTTGEYEKVEDYFKSAKRIYTKLEDKSLLAYTNRELGKVQESQNKIDEAIISFEIAGRQSKDKTMIAVNLNDANRLRNSNKVDDQMAYIQQNIDLLDVAKHADDKVLAYQQMAKINIIVGDQTKAIANLDTALIAVKDIPEQAIKINNEIAQVYAVNREHEKAIAINEKLVSDAKLNSNASVQIKQLQALASAYFDANQSGKGFSTLTESYHLALAKHYTLDAKNCINLIAEQYAKQRKIQKVVQTYQGFMDKLEMLIHADSTLIDAEFFLIHEDKISRLERERELKDELIEQKNTFNYVLIACIVLMLCSLYFIVKVLYSIKKKNKKIALQSLRREMNPHFIFNSLNSVNQFIAQNNELEANKYLTSYSKLMRTMMENSNKDFIPLSTEINHLREYLELEHLRFQDKFSYDISISDELDADAILVPNMLIQPQLENAIWHGLRYTDSGGLLKLSVQTKTNFILVIIEDNGIGIKRSKELKTKYQGMHNSRGLINIQERIDLLNSIYNSKITIEIIDKEADETGVKVMIQFPIMNNIK